MHTTRTDISSTKIKLNIIAGEEDLLPIKQQVVARLGRNVKVAGFRAGKAPAGVVEKNIDPNQLQSDFLDEAMTQLYARGSASEHVRPVTRPDVTVKKFVPFTALEFDVETSIIGKITLPDYKKIKQPKEVAKVVAKDVDGVVASLQNRMATKAEVKRAAKLKDEVVIDFKGADAKGSPIPNADGKDYPLALGSGAFIPGFEEEVVGIKAGEEKTFTLTFPKDYGAAELAGQKVTFTVNAKAVNELQEPKADDDFATTVGPFKNLTELKEDIKKQLTNEREREATAAQQDALLKAISTKSKVDLPDALIDQQNTYNVDESKRTMGQRGLLYEKFLKQEKLTEEEHKASFKEQSINQLKASLVLAEIADKEGMSVSPEELNAQIAILKQQYPDAKMQQQLDAEENRRDIASRMLSEKVMNLLTQ